MPGQKHMDVASLFWALQGFRVAYVEIRKATVNREPGRRIRVVGLEDVRNHKVCSECGKRHREGVIQEWEARMWRDCSLGATWRSLPGRWRVVEAPASSRFRGRLPGIA